MPHRRRAVDYGDALLWSAVMVSATRWAGAFLAADVGVVEAWVSTALHYANLVSGVAMGILEVVAIAYMLNALRSMPGGRRGARWYGTLAFAMALLLLSPLILSPYIVGRMNQNDLVEVLAETAGVLYPDSRGFALLVDYLWAVLAIIAPVLVVGGVAFARYGLVGVNVQRDEPTHGGTSAAPGAASPPERPNPYPRTCECGYMAVDRFQWSGHFKVVHPVNMRKKNPPASPSPRPAPESEEEF